MVDFYCNSSLCLQNLPVFGWHVMQNCVISSASITIAFIHEMVLYSCIVFTVSHSSMSETGSSSMRAKQRDRTEGV